MFMQIVVFVCYSVFFGAAGRVKSHKYTWIAYYHDTNLVESICTLSLLSVFWVCGKKFFMQMSAPNIQSSHSFDGPSHA